jgi:hypothetical protein
MSVTIIQHITPCKPGPQRSGNLIENKHSYAQNAGMLLKTKVIEGIPPVVGGEK